MSPPLSGPSLDLEAVSGICGSVSIACWVVVFSPQIVENFRRSSAEGLSLIFIIVWLLGDVFNILGAVLQGVLPTMTILAVYYTFADIVLLGQCFYYRGWTLSDAPSDKSSDAIEDEETVQTTQPTEESPLLPHEIGARTSSSRPRISHSERSSARGSFSSLHPRLTNNTDATHLSPTSPLIRPPKPTVSTPAAKILKPRSALSAFLFNLGALVLVCAAGVLGWWLSSRSSSGQYPKHDHHRGSRPHDTSANDTSSLVRFDLWGQIFGYLCAALYLGSRIPQLLLNHKRKSTEGVSLLFFLFACVGNLTYVLSIFAYEPSCARIERFDDDKVGCQRREWAEAYGRYVLVNTSWLVGSAGTLLLDLLIFGQFWIYRDKSP